MDPPDPRGLQLSDATREGVVAMGIELRPLYSSRHRLHHHNAAGRPIDPTIYKTDPQIRGSPTLPPPRQPVESEGTGSLAGGETRETWLLLFASH
jgi:hypothetical protein